MSEITRCAIGMPFEMAMSSELSRRQFHLIAQALLAERDQLKAENDALRKDADRYRRLRAGALAHLNDTEDEFDAEFERQLDAAMGKGDRGGQTTSKTSESADPDGSKGGGQ